MSTTQMKRNEKILIGVLLLALLLCLLWLAQSFFRRPLGTASVTQPTPPVAWVESVESDVRRNPADRPDWVLAHPREVLSAGDQISTGPLSRTDLRISKTAFRVQPQSLLRLRNPGQGPTTELLHGEFWVFVEGRETVLVGGENVELRGDRSWIRVRVGRDQRAEVTLLGGKAEVQVSRLPAQQLPVAQPQALPSEVPERILPAEPAPIPERHVAPIAYHWKLFDLYVKKSEALFKKSETAIMPAVAVDLRWKDELTAPLYYVEHASSPQFAMSHSQAVTDKTARIEPVYSGLNFWRVSRDQKKWSPPQSFQVHPEWAPFRPTFNRDKSILLVVDRPAPFHLEWAGDSQYHGYVVEISDNPRFPASETQVYWSTGTALSLEYRKPEVLFFQVRGVTKDLKLSQASPTLRLTIENPPLLPAPLLPKVHLLYELTEMSNPVLHWRGRGNSASYQVEVWSASKLLAQKTVTEEKLLLERWPTGDYRYRVAGVDAWGRPGAWSHFKAFRLVTPVPQLLAKPDLLGGRTPASIGTSVAGRELGMGPQNTLSPVQSFVAVEGASFAMLSSEQAYRGQPVAAAATVGVHAQQWWGDFGTEESLKTKAFSYTSTGSEVSPLVLEVRAHRRSTRDWHWFKFLRELQASAFVGWESYTNKASALYSRGYNLLKIGTQLKFPVGDRWETGGEFVYGRGFEESQKYEVSGLLNYFLQRQISFGVGYRFHMFEAGSAAATPTTLPYRESYLEGYSSLQYHY